MTDEGILLKEQSYSFLEIFSFFLYKRKDVWLLLGYFFFFMLHFAYGNSFHFWILLYPFTMILFMYATMNAAVIKNVYEFQGIWNRYAFSAETAKLIEKDHCLFLQNGNQRINLSNCLSEDLVSVTESKKKLILSVRYLKLFFVIGKSEACYEKIHYYMQKASKCESAVCVDACLHSERISRLCSGVSFSDQRTLMLKKKEKLWNGVLLAALFLNLALFIYFEHINWLIPKSFSGINITLIFTLFWGMGVCLIVFLIRQIIKACKMKKTEKACFIRSFDQTDIYVRRDMMVLNNPVHYMEVPPDARFLYHISDGLNGHFLIESCYGNFYINIPEQETEKIQIFENAYREFM